MGGQRNGVEAVAIAPDRKPAVSASLAIMVKKQVSGERDANYLKQATRGVYRCPVSPGQF
ncbi:hypothetical protein E1H12_10095 [Geitlerinema sp. P-1104]|nr:hypothetical protein [Geitlerinema sp. P-1104]